MKRLNFSSINISDLEKVVDLKLSSDKDYFQEWFEFEYNFSVEENLFLEKLLKRVDSENRFKVGEFSEEEIKMKFISPILNRVDFVGDNYQDWYERQIKSKINGVLFNGTTDFIVASGEFEPEKPLFFIQEFKKSFKANSPIGQILAEMMVALEINSENLIRGAFTYGSIWQFIVLEKVENLNYRYAISESFDSFKLSDLKLIYKNLVAVKNLYCEKS
jgi:hypothetical protein